MKSFKKIVAVLIALLPTLFCAILFELDAKVMMVVFLASAFASISMFIEDIKELKIGSNSLEIKRFEKAIEKAEKVNDDMNVTLEEFKKTIAPMLDFNLGLLAKDGTFDNQTKFNYVVPFAKSAKNIYRDIDIETENTAELLKIADAKVLQAFNYEVSTQFPEIRQPVRSYISTGLSDVIGGQDFETEPFVEIKKLEDLKEQLPADKKENWENIVQCLKNYYKD